MWKKSKILIEASQPIPEHRRTHQMKWKRSPKNVTLAEKTIVSLSVIECAWRLDPAIDVVDPRNIADT